METLKATDCFPAKRWGLCNTDSCIHLTSFGVRIWLFCLIFNDEAMKIRKFQTHIRQCMTPWWRTLKCTRNSGYVVANGSLFVRITITRAQCCTDQLTNLKTKLFFIPTVNFLTKTTAQHRHHKNHQLLWLTLYYK